MRLLAAVFDYVPLGILVFALREIITADLAFRYWILNLQGWTTTPGGLLGAPVLPPWPPPTPPDLLQIGVGAALWVAIMLVGAALWVGVILFLFEWKTGRTPGKMLLGLRTVSEDGTTLAFWQALVRRLPFMFRGWLTLVDVVFIFRRPKHQRAFDIVAGTMVIDDRRSSGRPPIVWNRPLSTLIRGGQL
jgi:uncharacterized RDD family membrane protein YckC